MFLEKFHELEKYKYHAECFVCSKDGESLVSWDERYAYQGKALLFLNYKNNFLCLGKLFCAKHGPKAKK